MKRAERRLRRAILSALGDPSRPAADLDLPPDPRILVVRPDRLGDALVSTPLIGLLRNRFPDASLDVLLGRRNAAAGPLLPDVDARLLFRGLRDVPALVALRRRRYHVVVNSILQGSATAALLSRVAGGVHLLERPWQGADDSGGSGHIVCRLSRLLEPLGIPPITAASEARHPLHVVVPEAARRDAAEILGDLAGPADTGPRVAINMSAGSARDGTRLWTEHRTAEVARGLRSDGLVPVLCAAPPDRAALERCAALTNGAALVLPTTADFSQYAALLAEVDLVVTPDTAVTHLAAALGRPTVALFDSQDHATSWRPWGVPHRIIANPGGVNRIDPADVRAAVHALQSETSQRR